MNWTLRRIEAATKKWSMNEKWFGARMTGPVGGTLSVLITRARKNDHEYSSVSERVAS